MWTWIFGNLIYKLERESHGLSFCGRKDFYGFVIRSSKESIWRTSSAEYHVVLWWGWLPYKLSFEGGPSTSGGGNCIQVSFTVNKCSNRCAFAYKAATTSTQLFGSLLFTQRPENKMFCFKPKEHLARHKNFFNVLCYWKKAKNFELGCSRP